MDLECSILYVEIESIKFLSGQCRRHTFLSVMTQREALKDTKLSVSDSAATICQIYK